jgi:phosphoglycerate-specific signal transduction histidine kinase
MDKSNKDAIIIMTTNNLIISNRIDVQRQINAFEEKFDHFYDDVRSNMKNN